LGRKEKAKASATIRSVWLSN